MRCALLLAPALASAAKQPCNHYFGTGTDNNSTLITVIDPDLPAAVCTKYNASVPCAAVHHSGPFSMCMSPGPPDACHRYIKTWYLDCDALADGENGSHVGWAGGVDLAQRFDLSTGALKECANSVLKHEISCWGPPADDPVACTCPTVAPTPAPPAPAPTPVPAPPPPAPPAADWKYHCNQNQKQCLVAASGHSAVEECVVACSIPNPATAGYSCNDNHQCVFCDLTSPTCTFDSVAACLKSPHCSY